jgi:hypothetical protein
MAIGPRSITGKSSLNELTNAALGKDLRSTRSPSFSHVAFPFRLLNEVRVVKGKALVRSPSILFSCDDGEILGYGAIT